MGLAVSPPGPSGRCRDVLRLHRDEHRGLVPIPGGQAAQHAPGHGPHPRLENDVPGAGVPRLGQLVCGLSGQGGVALDDPGGHRLVPGPAGVLDELPAVGLRHAGGVLDRLVVGEGEDLRLGSAGLQNGLGPGGDRAGGEVHMGRQPSRRAAQATPRPWLPSVAVTNSTLAKALRAASVCRAAQVRSSGRPSTWPAARAKA